jgi:hypothetical protein
VSRIAVGALVLIAFAAPLFGAGRSAAGVASRNPDSAAGRDAGSDFDRRAATRAAAVERLISKGSADSLAAAAALKQFGAEEDSGAYALAARAVQLAPARRDLAWLAIRLCNSASDCDPAQPEQHLRSIDPNNGVGLMGELRRAQSRNDAAAIDATLTAIGDSDHLYVYFAPLVAATAPELALALAEARPTGSRQPSGKDLSRAAAEMIGVIAASALPPSQSFSYSCKGLALQLEGRVARCRRAAQAFERADTFIGEGLGLSLQQQLWPLDSPEGRAITRRRRVFQYRLEEYSKLSISSPKADELPANVVDVFRAHEREQDAALVYFAKAGVPADPPADWTSNTLPRVP